MFMKNRSIRLPVADFLLKGFEGFAGYDFTAPENIPDLELLFDWERGKEADEAFQKHGVYAVRLLPGKADEVKRFYARFKEEWRMRQVEQSIGDTIFKVLSFLQRRPEGDYIVEYVGATENIDKVANKILRSDEPAFKNMRDAFIRFSGIDLTGAENMPKLELLFDWSADHGFRIGEAAMARSI
jgi:hypothetical protein